MTEAQAIEALLQRWLDAWPALQPGVPQTFDNEVFDGVASWARVSVQHSTRVQITMGPDGARKFDTRGRIMVQLFSAIDGGRKPLAELAHSARAVYEARKIADEIVTYGGASREAGTDGRWAMHVVTIPFRYDETR